MHTKLKKDKTFSARIANRHRNDIIKKHGSLQKFLDLCIELDRKNILKPLDRALYNIDQQNSKGVVQSLKTALNNKAASESWSGYDEPDDSLDKKVQQLNE